MSIKVGIVEDTLEYIETLRILLAEQKHDVHIVRVAASIEEALLLLQDKEIELAFLDIQLQSGTIFEVLDKLVPAGNKLPEIVFVTAHGSFEYATKAIQFACLDFITKPVSAEALGETLDRYDQRKDYNLMTGQVAFLLDLLKGNMKAPKSIGIVMPKGVIEFLELRDIIYFHADANICEVKLSSGKILTSTKHLGYYIDLLSGHEDFVQISKNSILNATFIKRYDHRDKTIILKNEEHLLVSHRFSKHLKKVLLNQQDGSIMSKIANLFR